FQLVSDQKKSGEDVAVLCCTKSNNEKSDDPAVISCKTTFFFARVYFSYEYILKWVTLRKQFEIIHIHCPHPFASALLFLFRTKARVVIHWHSDIVRPKFLKKIYYPLQYWMLKRANKILVTSPNYAEESKDLAPFREKIHIVPIGIDPSFLQVEPSTVAQVKKTYPDKIIIFSLGRHVYYKGYRYLLRAISCLPEKFILLLGGTGPETEALKSFSEELGITERVSFLGEISAQDLGAYYQACDLFCLPSVERAEAFGVVQLEAMSMGKAVVSTNIEGSGVGWVNKDGVSGLTVLPRDSMALAAALKKLSEEPFEADQIISYVKNNFSNNTMMLKVEECYQSLF
ncbi:MAG: glycosyltransferase, partial [Desulfovibrionales bacterium]|nr:glycosyltransferase [Desulfovibrionales bacterium]